MQSVPEVGAEVLRAARLPAPLHAACIDALSTPGRLFSPKSAWADLFLAWVNALSASPREPFLVAAAACEYLAAGYDLLDDAHEQWGAAPSKAVSRCDIAVGVTLLLLAEETLARLDLPAERRTHAIAAIGRSGHRAWAGQMRDDLLRRMDNPCLGDAFAVLRHRSGVLAAAPCQCAALLAGAPWRVVGLAGRFGHALGCAAQLEDDLADRHEDAPQGRNTIPSLLARLHPTTPDLAEATTWALIQHHLRIAAHALARLPVATIWTEPLWALLPATLRSV